MRPRTKATMKDLEELLAVASDCAAELGLDRLARRLRNWKQELGCVTANDVAVAVGLEPFPLVLTGRRSGRTMRMICEAVALAANGNQVMIDPLPRGFHHDIYELAIQTATRYGGKAVAGRIHRPSHRTRAMESAFAATYCDHMEAFSHGPWRGITD